jgi:hypothetical protein
LSLADWTGVTASIGSWLKRTDYTSIAPDLISMAEQDINDELRVNQMEVELAGLNVTAGYIAHPSDWLSWKEIEATVNGFTYPLRPMTEETATEKTSGETNPPRYYVVRGNKTYPKPYQNGTYSVIYYQQVPALLSSATSNWVTLRYPQLYLYGALAHAKLFFDDKTLMYFEQKKSEILARIRRDGVRRSYGKQVLQMKADVTVL